MPLFLLLLMFFVSQTVAFNFRFDCKIRHPHTFLMLLALLCARRTLRQFEARAFKTFEKVFRDRIITEKIYKVSRTMQINKCLETSLVLFILIALHSHTFQSFAQILRNLFCAIFNSNVHSPRALHPPKQERIKKNKNNNIWVYTLSM